jgi:hypothetical protein
MLFGKIRAHRRAAAVVAGIAGAAVVGTAAWAYWTQGGSGSGSATVASSVSDIVVTQTAPVGTLVPGDSVALSGTLTNPNKTDIKVGSLSATITAVSNGAAISDFSVTGGPVIVNAVVKKGTPVAWSGLTLTYANSDVNQDNAKGATVTISYTLSPFAENVLPPLGTLRVITVNGVKTFDIYIHTVAETPPTVYTIVPGDTLSTYDQDATFGTPAWADNLATADANGNIRYSAPVPTPGHHYQITVKHSGTLHTVYSTTGSGGLS